MPKGGTRIGSGSKSLITQQIPDITINETHIAECEIMIKNKRIPAKILKVFRELGPEVYSCGRLKTRFLDSFLEMCECKVQITELKKILDKDGWYNTDEKGTVRKHVMIQQYNENKKNYRQFIGQFGLTPSAERGLTTVDNSKDDGFDSI